MRNFFLLFFLFASAIGFAQSDALAKNYFEQGEFEKALSIYEKLSQTSPYRMDYFMGVVESNQQLENFSEVERLIKQRIADTKNMPQLYVELGYNYSIQGKTDLAADNYQKAIQSIEDNTSFTYHVGRAFQKYSLLEEAIAVYESAMALNDKMDFNLQLAQIYGEQGKLQKMFESYLNIIERNQSFKNTAQRYFSMYVNEDPTNEANIILRNALLRRSQQNPEVLYNELLSWLFVQQKEYQKAFTQEKAIYRRVGDDLSRIVDLSYIAIADEDYDNAREIVNYVIESSYTPQNRLQGNQILMQMEVATARPSDYPAIEKRFEKLLDEFGRNKETHGLQIDYNHFLAFRNNKKEVAISNLRTLLKESLTAYQEARVKMELADILVFDEKFNQALIYYSQIQRKVQSDALAQEARFKVARTSYFKGDFDWAQVQLDVLKKSTSQLMANDAMQMSLLIKGNSLEDSTQTALKKYANADLLALQEKNTEAIAVLEEILLNHKGETIEDEVWLKQGEIYEKIGDYSKAETNYLKIIQFYADDILADDALFRLARIYEKLDQPEKAKEQYERILFNHADSIFFIEARKKYRMLRGDAIN